MPEPTVDGEPEPTAAGEPSPQGATKLRISVEPELQITAVKVRELATTPALRENAKDSVSGESSSAPCTVAEVEPSMAHAPCKRPPEPAPPERPPVPAPRKRPPEPAPPEHLPVLAPIHEVSPGSLEALKYTPSHPLLHTHRCRLAAPLLALSPPSMRCKLSGITILQRCHGWSFPGLHL